MKHQSAGNKLCLSSVSTVYLLLLAFIVFILDGCRNNGGPQLVNVPEARQAKEPHQAYSKAQDNDLKIKRDSIVVRPELKLTNALPHRSKRITHPIIEKKLVEELKVHINKLQFRTASRNPKQPRSSPPMITAIGLWLILSAPLLLIFFIYLDSIIPDAFFTFGILAIVAALGIGLLLILIGGWLYHFEKRKNDDGYNRALNSYKTGGWMILSAFIIFPIMFIAAISTGGYGGLGLFLLGTSLSVLLLIIGIIARTIGLIILIRKLHSPSKA